MPFTNKLVAVIASVKMHGQCFKLHKGMHCTHDDCCKAEELKERSAKVEELEKEKKNRLWCTSTKQHALKVIDKPLEELQEDEVKALLCHHGAEKSALTEKHLVRSVEGDSEG